MKRTRFGELAVQGGLNIFFASFLAIQATHIYNINCLVLGRLISTLPRMM